MQICYWISFCIFLLYCFSLCDPFPYHVLFKKHIYLFLFFLTLKPNSHTHSLASMCYDLFMFFGKSCLFSFSSASRISRVYPLIFVLKQGGSLILSMQKSSNLLFVVLCYFQTYTHACICSVF